MSIPDKQLGSVMVAFYASNIGAVNFVGVVSGVHDHPVVFFEKEPGEECSASWAAHLCRPATKDEEIAYWKGRALAATPSPALLRAIGARDETAIEAALQDEVEP